MCPQIFLLHYLCRSLFFFLNDTAPTEIYTLSLHDALPISSARRGDPARDRRMEASGEATSGLLRGSVIALADAPGGSHALDRKSTRLNSSHLGISYAVFCLKKKNINYITTIYLKEYNNYNC